jgi:serine/threonine protein kinase
MERMDNSLKFHTLPRKPKKIKTLQDMPLCGDVLHRPCPFCSLQNVQDFKILNRLGSGSFSNVFLATHPLYESPVVLKLLLKNGESKTLYENEVCILKKIKHPNIIKILDSFENIDFFALVLEYVPGRDLFDILKDHSSLSRNDQKEIFKQIVSGNFFINF